MTTAVRFLLLVGLWLALWADVSVANVASGALVAGVIVVRLPTWRRGEVVLRPLRALHFALYFLYKLVQSTVVVARIIVTPGRRVRTGIVAVPLRGCSDAVATLIADTISLTPGTLTIEVTRDPLCLYVHALDVRDVDEVQRDVRRVEELAVRAFGGARAVAEVAVDDTTSWTAR